MVLKDVDEIDWFTDGPDVVEGTWKPKKLIQQWDSFFEASGSNAQASFKIGDEREFITFEIYKPTKKKNKMIFDLDAISESG